MDVTDNDSWRRRLIIHRIEELCGVFDKAYGKNCERWPPRAAMVVRQINEASHDLDEAERLIESGERMVIEDLRTKVARRKRHRPHMAAVPALPNTGGRLVSH
jgi:hypothetical protein